MRYSFKKGDLVRLPADSILWNTNTYPTPHELSSPTYAVVLCAPNPDGWVNLFCYGAFYSIKYYEIDKVEEPNYANAGC